MQQQPSPSPAPNRATPTRPAAVALLLIDAALLVTPLLVRWQSWFAFAYIPLLFTVAWGVMLGGLRGTPAVILLSVPLLVFLAIGIALIFPVHNLDRFGYVLVGGQALLAGVGVAVIALATRGWIQFFRGRPAAAHPIPPQKIKG